MNSKVSELVTALAMGSTSVAQEAFASVMMQKVNDVLDERKVAVASQIFSNVQEQAEHEDEVESDEVEHDLEDSEEDLDEAAVDAKGHKSSTGGLTKKGRDYYNRKTGSNLKAPVTTAPSKLKKGSKAYNRRKSFCARMRGVKGPMRKPDGEPTRKALALRKWNC